MCAYRSALLLFPDKTQQKQQRCVLLESLESFLEYMEIHPAEMKW